MESVLTKKQFKTFGPVKFREYGKNYQITAEVRYDDECGNGINSFAITGTIHLCDVKGNPVLWDAGGCLHEEIAKHFPQLAPYIKWHLCGSDGPMYYIANTLYWLGYSGWCDGKPNDPPKLANARSTAVWPDMPETFLAGGNMTKESVTEALKSRLPATLIEFRNAVESLGFVF